MSDIQFISKDEFESIQNTLRPDETPASIVVGEVPYTSTGSFCTLPEPGEEPKKAVDRVYIDDASGEVYWQDTSDQTRFGVLRFKTELTPEDIGTLADSGWFGTDWEGKAQKDVWTESDLQQLLHDFGNEEKIKAYAYAKVLKNTAAYSEDLVLWSVRYWVGVGPAGSQHYDAAKQEIVKTLTQLKVSQVVDENRIDSLLSVVDVAIESADPELQTLGHEAFVALAGSGVRRKVLSVISSKAYEYTIIVRVIEEKDARYIAAGNAALQALVKSDHIETILAFLNSSRNFSMSPETSAAVLQAAERLLQEQKYDHTSFLLANACRYDPRPLALQELAWQTLVRVAEKGSPDDQFEAASVLINSDQVEHKAAAMKTYRHLVTTSSDQDRIYTIVSFWLMESQDPQDRKLAYDTLVRFAMSPTHFRRYNAAAALLNDPEWQSTGLDAMVEIARRDDDSHRTDAANSLYYNGNAEQKQIGLDILYKNIMKTVDYNDGAFELEVTAFVRVLTNDWNQIDPRLQLDAAKKYQAESYVYDTDPGLVALIEKLSRDCGVPDYE